jgi:hypothetical protein
VLQTSPFDGVVLAESSRKALDRICEVYSIEMLEGHKAPHTTNDSPIISLPDTTLREISSVGISFE